MKKIVLLLSLILCLTTFCLVPSAQADEPFVVKNVSEFKVPGGEITSANYSVNPNTWTLLSGSGERKFTTHVDFKEAYKKTPIVALSLSGMDALNTANTRMSVTPTNVTEKGFDVEYKTWGNSQIWAVFVNWTAFGGK